jgi:hypothetical protein
MNTTTEKQTAVEWLIEEIRNARKLCDDSSIEMDIFHTLDVLINKEDKAKEMEKQQIIDAVDFINNNIILDDDKTGFITTHGDGYYNQTFNK